MAVRGVQGHQGAKEHPGEQEIEIAPRLGAHLRKVAVRREDSHARREAMGSNLVLQAS